MPFERYTIPATTRLGPLSIATTKMAILMEMKLFLCTLQPVTDTEEQNLLSESKRKMQVKLHKMRD